MQDKLTDFFNCHDIKGFLDHEEGLALYRYALEANSLGACLEIGSYCGKSAVYIGQACKETNNVLFAVDHHSGSEEHQPGEEYHDAELADSATGDVNSFPMFRRTLRLAELETQVIPVVTSSQTLAKYWKQALGFAFVDGGHSEEQAMHDVLAWASHLALGGVMAIHDVYATSAQGGQAPRLAMEALLKNPGWAQLEQIGSLAFLKKSGE